ncbi:MAG: hypothetical protein BA863_10415 [Desulfovibrio sp. S3730MH75]|nr:MAG: hypothetical protein BA863_10415 [Desulfovibrio sp. S3730MH75]
MGKSGKGGRVFGYTSVPGVTAEEVEWPMLVSHEEQIAVLLPIVGSREKAIECLRALAWNGVGKWMRKEND